MGRWLNSRAEDSYLPFRRRERVMQRFRKMKGLQKFVSVHANVLNHFGLDRQTYKAALSVASDEWQKQMA